MSANDVVVIREMLADGINFKVQRFTKWHDVGNVESLNVARKEIDDSFFILDKIDESVYLFDKFVIKFFSDPKIVISRVKRAKVLGNLVPRIVEWGGNFYKYKLIKGRLLSETLNPDDFTKFLEWSRFKLWKLYKETSDEKFYKICKSFYYDKTLARVDKFLKSRSLKDTRNIINGYDTPTLDDMLKMIDWNLICNTEQRTFHGDYILDNILKTETGYCLLDWRQDFGGLLKSGDIYYDLGKLNHNLTVNHSLINKSLFTIKIRKDGIVCDVLRKNNLVDCEKVFWEFVRGNNYDEKKIKLITALIWLNMSPLHSHPFDLFSLLFWKV